MMNSSSPFFLSINDEKQGPFTHDQIVAMHRNQQLKTATLYWQEGMADWEPIAKLEAELGSTDSPPPLPQASETPSAQGSNKLIIAGYICTVLTIIPLIGYLPGLIAIILGIQMCRKNITTHGIINIVTPIVIGFVMAPIVLIAVLTLMRDNIEETFKRVTAELEAASLSSTQAFSYEDADRLYAERRATPLTEDEQTIIGNWSGKNVEFEWEIMRKPDGTYALAYRFPDEGPEEDIVYGTWGIEDGQFYYMDLEVIGYTPEDAPEKFLEDINILTSDALVTSYVDEESKETIKSTEKRVTEFKFKIWDNLDKNGRYP